MHTGRPVQDFYSLVRPDAEAAIAAHGAAPVHAKSLYQRAYKDLCVEPWADARLPRRLQTAMAASWATQRPTVVTEHLSTYDGSVKFVLAMHDGKQVEAVLMPEKQRLTLCVSSQVGCAQGCVFCHTGRMGLTRNLSAGEIVSQIVHADAWVRAHPDWVATQRLKPNQRVTNVVFMGMGEPLDNADAVISAVRILTDPYGLALGMRRISVSTAGHLDGIEKLVAALPDVRLALSVHSIDDAKRSKIMPINRRWPLASVFETLKRLNASRPLSVMLQYTMIKGVNDTVGEAERLAELAAGIGAKVNLIPLNDVGASRLVAPSPAAIQEFRDVLHAKGLRVMVRYSKGQDIAAACGQLIVQPKASRLA